MQSFFSGLLHLMRPLEWTKSFGNMAIAAVTAAIVFGIPLSPIRFLAGFASVILLWSGLYALNDYTDRKADALHPAKKKRAIPSGAVSPAAALVFSLSLIFASIAIAFFLNGGGLFLLCILAMLLNQLLYTMKPFNLKKRPVLDLISGSLVNPFFRFYAGWVLFVPAFNAPISVVLSILLIQFGGFGLYRVYSKEHEEKLGMKSSVVRFNERRLRRLCYVSMAIGGLSYAYAALTVLPIRYLFWGIAMALAAPFYKTALKNPKAMDHKKTYTMVYLQYLVFSIGFILLYWFPIL